MDAYEKQKLIARPREKGIFSKTYFYGDEQFTNFVEALRARSEALDEAGIQKITESEIMEAERDLWKASGQAGFSGHWGFCTRGEENSIAPPEPGARFSEQEPTSQINTSSSDGIANLITAFAWINLVSGVILGFIFISAGSTGALLLYFALFNFALLSGFARIIKYLRQIAQK